MKEQALHVVQISATDKRGGAALVAWDLHQAYLQMGIRSELAVGKKLSDDPSVFEILNDVHRSRFTRRLFIAAATRAGIEDFQFPGTRILLEKIRSKKPDVLHCHNLHGGYFDLRLLPEISKHAPLFLTLHDAWMFTGHCAHSFDCDRWKTGCGHCPYLDTYPSIARDATAWNWKRKRSIYSKSRLHVATPSRWLHEQLKRSILWPSVIESRVIPNGVDLSLFQPGDQAKRKKDYGLPPDSFVVLFSASQGKNNPFKDYRTIDAAMQLLSKQIANSSLVFLVCGGTNAKEIGGNLQVRYMAEADRTGTLAQLYQMADVYVHAAKADTFPTAVLEALATGLPVVATAVGGIVEQIKSLSAPEMPAGVSTHPLQTATGILTPHADPSAMAAALFLLQSNVGLREALGRNARQDALERFSVQTAANLYINWYREIRERSAFSASASSLTKPQVYR